MVQYCATHANFPFSLPRMKEGGRTSHVLSSSTTQGRSRRRLRGSVRRAIQIQRSRNLQVRPFLLSSRCRYPKYEMCMNNTSCKAARRLLKQQQEGKEEEQLQRVRLKVAVNIQGTVSFTGITAATGISRLRHYWQEGLVRAGYILFSNNFRLFKTTLAT